MEMGHSEVSAAASMPADTGFRSLPNTLLRNETNKIGAREIARIPITDLNARLGLCGVCELRSSNLVLPAPRSSCDPVPHYTLQNATSFSYRCSRSCNA